MLVAIAVGSPGLAQESAGLETIIVRAHKRDEPLHDVPASISTLTAKEISAGGVESVGDIAQRMPTFDLQQSNSPVTTSFRVRRVGNLGNVPTFEPAVGLFVDGAFRSRSFLAGDLLDVERVEVLSGPQVTLYGKNASGGVVALYTAKPAHEPRVDAEMSWGVIDVRSPAHLFRARAGVSGSLAGTVRASLAAASAEHGHTILNAIAGGPDGNDQNRVTVRGQLVWSPSDAFELRLITGYLREHDDQGESDVVLSSSAGSTGLISALHQAGVSGWCPDNTPHNGVSCSLAASELGLQALDTTLHAEHRFANGVKLTSITAWDRYQTRRKDDDVAQLMAPALFYHDSDEGRTLQEELRLTSAGNARLGWLLGAFYYRNDYERGRHGGRPMFGWNGNLASHGIWTALLGMPLALPGQQGMLDSRVDTRYLGFFGESKWRLAKRVAVTLGVRWQEEEKEASIHNTVSVPGASLISSVLAAAVAPGGAAVNGAVRRRSDDLAWSVTPQFQLAPDLTAYATVARGAKFGGFNVGFGNAPLADREFGDESVRHHELGAKFDTARISLGAAVFHTEYRNYQDATFSSAQFNIGNVARVELQGFELGGKWLLRERTIADFSVSRADLRYDENIAGMCYPGRVPDGTLPGSCDLSGAHPINAPEWATHLGVEHASPTRLGEIYARLDWSWTDDYNTSFSADPRRVQSAYSDVGLRIGARLAGDREIVLWGANLLDERVSYIDAVLNLFNDTSYQSFLADARSYGVTLRARF